MTDPALARILVSNDDGINAPGLELLERIARELSPEVWFGLSLLNRNGAALLIIRRRQGARFT